MKAIVVGIKSETISEVEKEMLQQINPYGVILFKRNCTNKEQVINLIKDLKTILNNENLAIFIDQEGGRVQRLKAPNFDEFPAAGDFVKIANEKGLKEASIALFESSNRMGKILKELGITHNCAPMVDLLYPFSDNVIGDRSFGGKVEQVVILARVFIKAMEAHGVTPIIKHIPGHGRAKVDSHELLPVVEASLEELEKTDFEPFKQLQDAPMAMTAHIVYNALDADHPVTTSKKAINYIRENIYPSGLIISDALEMKALGGEMRERVKAAFEAGCDLVLHCTGNLEELSGSVDIIPEFSRV